MNELQIFTSPEFGTVRTAEIDGKPYFCGKDVAQALGYALKRKAISDHCKGVLKWNVLTNGGKQEMVFIPEGDLYRLITHSKLPSAERFERWVFDEVLPSIRKNGMWATEDLLNNPDFLLATAQKLKEQKEQIALLEKQKTELERQATVNRYKSDYYDYMATSHNADIKIGEFVKVLQSHNIWIGERAFFEWLRAEEYLTKGSKYKRNFPRSEYLKAGIFKVIEHKIDHIKEPCYTTLITPKGRAYFINKFIEMEMGVRE